MLIRLSDGLARLSGGLYLSAALSVLLCGFGSQAQAQAPGPGSAGCQAINNGTPQLLSIVGSSIVFVGAGFASGDRITINVHNLLPGQLGSGALTVTDSDANPIMGTFPNGDGTWGPFTYSAAADGQLWLGNPNVVTFGGFFTFTCVGPPSTGPTNSQILDQTKQTYSKVAAQTYSQATGDAASGAIGDAFSGGGTTQFGANGFSTNFAALENARDRDDEVRESSDPFAALAYGKKRIAYTNAPFRKAPPKLQSPWHVWIDGRFTGLNDRSAIATNFDGWHSNITSGASYRFTQNFLAGVLVGYENFKYSLTAVGVPTSLDGRGVSGGGYFGWKFYDRLRLDGMLTYGRIDYNAGAGGVTGSFGADRVTGMTKLSGRYGFGNYFVEPSSMLTIASERQGSFTDTAAVFHDTFNFTVGRSSNGATIGTPLAWGMCVVTPTFGAFADYRFGDQTTAAANVVPTFNNGWSAHVNGGLNIQMPNNVTASASGEYGGLGDSIQYWRAKGSLGVKF